MTDSGLVLATRKPGNVTGQTTSSPASTATVAGLVDLQAEPGGDVGIVVLGLVPRARREGFGGPLLTLATRRAWELTPGGARPRRAQVRTSSRDHPHAIAIDERRGFRRYR